MRRAFIFILAIPLVCCQSNKTSDAETEYLFKPMVEEEIIYVARNMEGLKNDKGKDWYKGDSIFFTLWMKGAREELNGNYKKAIEFYYKALNTERYEISSYEVKLSLGRTYLQIRDKQKAKKMLMEFKQEAKKDLSGEDVEWGLTNEAKEALVRDIENCDYLLGMADAK